MSSLASIFISYSHADADLARALADELRSHELKVWIDEGELRVGDSLIERIATAIAEIDFFLALVSEASRNSNWCRKELALAVTGELGREGVKVLPVRVDGASLPASLADVYYLELRPENVAEVAAKVAEAVPQHQAEAEETKQHRQQRSKPVDGAAATVSPASSTTTGEYEPISIVGIVEEGVGRPRSDGTRGSALYRIPLRLSRRPSSVWARHFVETWDRPPRWTTMHRPGIASVSGDTVVLDGTTMEELEKYHVETLRHVLQQVNSDIAEHERKERARAQREAETLRRHDETVRDIAGRIKFD